jgi:hypothetical protein
MAPTPSPSTSRSGTVTLRRSRRSGGSSADAASWCPNRTSDPRAPMSASRLTSPNERWQLDITHWALADGTDVEILNVLDDHSRLAVGSDAAVGKRSPRATTSLRTRRTRARPGSQPRRPVRRHAGTRGDSSPQRVGAYAALSRLCWLHWFVDRQLVNVGGARAGAAAGGAPGFGGVFFGAGGVVVGLVVGAVVVVDGGGLPAVACARATVEICGATQAAALAASPVLNVVCANSRGVNARARSGSFPLPRSPRFRSITKSGSLRKARKTWRRSRPRRRVPPERSGYRTAHSHDSTAGSNARNCGKYATLRAVRVQPPTARQGSVRPPSIAFGEGEASVAHFPRLHRGTAPTSRHRKSPPSMAVLEIDMEGFGRVG